MEDHRRGMNGLLDVEGGPHSNQERITERSGMDTPVGDLRTHTLLTTLCCHPQRGGGGGLQAREGGLGYTPIEMV